MRSAVILGSATLLAFGIAGCQQQSQSNGGGGSTAAASDLKIVEQIPIDANGAEVKPPAGSTPADPAGDGKATCPPVSLAMAGALTGADAALGRDRVAPGREYLGDAGGLEAGRGHVVRDRLDHLVQIGHLQVGMERQVDAVVELPPRIRLVVLFGGRSAEHEVSRVSAPAPSASTTSASVTDAPDASCTARSNATSRRRPMPPKAMPARPARSVSSSSPPVPAPPTPSPA